MSFAKTSSAEKSSIILDFLKGLIVSMLISSGLVILLAFSLKWFSLDEKFIMPLNLAIKTISVVIGASIAIKGDSKGLIKGILFGLVYVLFAFLCFSLLAKSFAVDLSLLLDILFASIAGGIVGIVKVNSK